MATILDFPPRVQDGKLRVFDNAEDANSWLYKTGHWRAKICVVKGQWNTWLRWSHPRPLPRRTERRLRDFLNDGLICCFGLRDYYGFADSIRPGDLKFAASTICKIARVRP